MDIDIAQDLSKEQLDVTGKIKRGLLGAFHKMYTNMKVGRRFYYASTVVMLLQLCYLPFSGRAQFAWPSAMENQLQGILGIFAFGFLDYSSEWVFYLIESVAVVSVAASAVGIVCLGHDEVYQTSKYTMMIYPTEILLRLNQTVLLIPYIGILTRFIMCDDTSLSACAESAPRIILGIVSSVALGLLIVTSWLNSWLMVQFTPFNERGKRVDGIFGASHGRVELINTAIRSTLAFVLGCMPSASSTETVNTTVKTIWAVVLIGGGMGLCGGYLYFLPFLQMKWNKFSIGSYAIFLWLTVCLLVTQIIDDPTDKSSRVLFVAALPFLIFSLVSMVNIRIQKLADPSTELILLNPYLCEVRLRLLHLNRDFPDGFIFRGDVEDGYKLALEAFPGSAFLRLYIAQLCTSSKRIMFALSLTREAKEQKLNFDTEFSLFVLNKHNQDKNGNESGAISFMSFDQYMTEARQNIVSTLKQTVIFWRALYHGKYSIQDLIDQGAKIHHEAENCKSHISKLLKISKCNPEALKLYAIFVHYVLNDQISAMKVMDRIGSHSNEEGSGYAVATVSGNPSTIGKVLDVTEAMAQLFGYAKRDMVSTVYKLAALDSFGLL